MLGIDYNSDQSESDAEDTAQNLETVKTTQISNAGQPSTSKSSFNLPPPRQAASKPSSGLALPAPKAKRVKKIAIGLPELSKDEADDELEDEPLSKKPRLGAAGVSSLLGMLPAPKQKVPTLLPPTRVLGGGKGGGLNFSAGMASLSTRPLDTGTDEDDGNNAGPATQSILPPTGAKAAPALMPPSLGKGRKNVNLEAIEAGGRPVTTYIAPAPTLTPSPAVDFFSLGTVTSKNSTPVAPPVPGPSARSLQLSSAPKVEDFTPPEPTQTDEYPGYYKLPSGSWAAYEPEYYKKFYKKWQMQYDAHVRAMEKGARGFEQYDEDEAAEVNAAAEMERAKIEVQEREERKALTTGQEGEPEKPRMNVQGAKLGGRARSRHQLTTLLTEAYQNREALEEQIAQGKRNRKEAGTKYGF